MPAGDASRNAAFQRLVAALSGCPLNLDWRSRKLRHRPRWRRSPVWAWGVRPLSGTWDWRSHSTSNAPICTPGFMGWPEQRAIPGCRCYLARHSTQKPEDHSEAEHEMVRRTGREAVQTVPPTVSEIELFRKEPLAALFTRIFGY